MNWMRIALAAVVAGIVLWLVDYVLHGMIMASTYTSNPEVFSQEAANPVWFLVISICIALMVTILFARTRTCWGDGFMGGATFGFFIGLVAFFGNFYHPLVIDGFPYYLAWCWGGINVIDGVVGGAVIGLIYKE